MRNYERFLRKHCRPLNEMTLKEIKSLYNKLPTVITLFQKPPEIKDFVKFDVPTSNDCYASFIKMKLFIINLKTKTLSIVLAQVAVCFEFMYDNYYPVHVYRINFDTSVLIYSQRLPETFFEK